MPLGPARIETFLRKLAGLESTFVQTPDVFAQELQRYANALAGIMHQVTDEEKGEILAQLEKKSLDIMHAYLKNELYLQAPEKVLPLLKNVEADRARAKLTPAIPAQALLPVETFIENTRHKMDGLSKANLVACNEFLYALEDDLIRYRLKKPEEIKTIITRLSFALKEFASRVHGPLKEMTAQEKVLIEPILDRVKLILHMSSLPVISQPQVEQKIEAVEKATSHHQYGQVPGDPSLFANKKQPHQQSASSSTSTVKRPPPSNYGVMPTAPPFAGQPKPRENKVLPSGNYFSLSLIPTPEPSANSDTVTDEQKKKQTPQHNGPSTKK